MRGYLTILGAAAVIGLAAATGTAEAAQAQFNFSSEKPDDEIRYGGASRPAAEPAESRTDNARSRRARPAASGSARQSRRASFGSRYASTPRSTYRGKRTVRYSGSHAPGTIVVKTGERQLYYVLPGGKAIQYGVGVGRQGFTWRGRHRISRKAEWPGWTPPAAMRKRQPNLPKYMPGGPNNPLGARALYIGGTLYRIHGTNQAWSIGRAVSSGCIRMLNEEVVDLYNRVRIGTRVVVQ